MKRTVPVETPQDLEQTINAMVVQGYDVQKREPGFCRLSRKSQAVNHLAVFLWTVWWTFGLGNLLYHFIATGGTMRGDVVDIVLTQGRQEIAQ